MYYEINVAYNGRHLFATDSRSIVNEHTLFQVLKVILNKFPESEKYQVTVSHHPRVSEEMNIKGFLGRYEREYKPGK